MSESSIWLEIETGPPAESLIKVGSAAVTGSSSIVPPEIVVEVAPPPKTKTFETTRTLLRSSQLICARIKITDELFITGRRGDGLGPRLFGGRAIATLRRGQRLTRSGTASRGTLRACSFARHASSTWRTSAASTFCGGLPRNRRNQSRFDP